MATVLIIIGAVLAGLLAVFAVIALVLRHLARGRMDQARAALHGQGILRITPMANFFGRRSASMAQIRGNGVLALTPNELAFFMLAPAREHHLPLASVEAVENPRWFRGKSVGRPLLVVRFTDEEGRPDAYGYYVRDPAGWTDRVTAAAAAARSGKPLDGYGPSA
ncbi:MAG: hypothetical protein KKF41_13405 [Actinobacteria bacterium]|nr:hypothetical protein [Actinomycetota bacterium]MBU1943904.1 hypothetical protein [Actinomycetota bacterium]MBU2688574.1 hypothetical protein [Actinomycetota bacterium]